MVFLGEGGVSSTFDFRRERKPFFSAVATDVATVSGRSNRWDFRPNATSVESPVAM